MEKLQPHEILLLSLVEKKAPVDIDEINLEYSDKRENTMHDIGYLINHGFIKKVKKHYSLTGKGETFLKNWKSEVVPVKGTDPNFTGLVETVVEPTSGFNSAIKTALSDLEMQLAMEPVDIQPVDWFDMKCNVIDRLSDLLDPSISSVLIDIKTDLMRLQEKAA